MFDLAKRRSREKVVAPQDNIRESATVDLLDRFTDEGLAPVDDAIRGEATRLLHVAIAGLPEEYQQVINLRDIKGLELEEIAKMIGKSVNSVRSLRHRAIKRLRMELIRLSRLL